VYAYFNRPPPTRTVVATTREITIAPPGRSGFVGSAPPITETKTVVETAPEPTTVDKISSPATKLGVSLVLGFIVGFVFRMFVKTMTVLTILVVAGLGALSYYGILDIDTQQVEEKGRTFVDWITREGGRIKDLVLGHIPHSAGGVVGSWIGFRRK